MMSSQPIQYQPAGVSIRNAVDNREKHKHAKDEVQVLQLWSITFVHLDVQNPRTPAL